MNICECVSPTKCNSYLNKKHRQTLRLHVQGSNATQDTSKSVSFKRTASADVNYAKYGDAHPLARSETIVSKVTVGQNEMYWKHSSYHS